MQNFNLIRSLKSSKHLYVEWYPTDFCNYGCSYCSFAGNFDLVRYQKNFDIVYKNFVSLFAYYQDVFTKTDFTLRLCGGGEPTLWPYFYKFCEKIKKDFNIKLEVVSNGSRTINWWNKHKEYLDKIYLSFHSEFAHIDNYIKVLDFLYENNKDAECLLMMDTHNWNTCLKNYKKLLTSKYPWAIHAKNLRATEEYTPEPLTVEQKDFFNNPVKRLPDSVRLLKQLNDLQIYEGISSKTREDSYVVRKLDDYSKPNFKNWSCNILKARLKITADGNITGNCRNGFDNLNLFSENFESELQSQLFSNFICPSDTCFINHNHHVSKHKI